MESECISPLEFQDSMKNYYRFCPVQKQELMLRFIRKLEKQVLSKYQDISNEDLQESIEYCTVCVYRKQNYDAMFSFAYCDEFTIGNLGVINCIWLRQLFDYVSELRKNGEIN